MKISHKATKPQSCCSLFFVPLWLCVNLFPEQLLVEGQKLDAVLSMSLGVFKPYAGILTVILFLTRTDSGEENLTQSHQATKLLFAFLCGLVALCESVSRPSIEIGV
jgi:hypothetical protein